MSQHESRAGDAAPRWTGEFPIVQAEEFRVSRRGFTIACCAAAAAGAAGLGIAGASDSSPAWEEFDGGVLAGFEPGTDRIVTNPHNGEPVLIVRLPSGEFRAFDQRCSHLLCPVHYDADKDKVFCPCHHGLFNAETGAPAGGPPRKPLPRHGVEARDGRIYVSMHEPGGDS